MFPKHGRKVTKKDGSSGGQAVPVVQTFQENNIKVNQPAKKRQRAAFGDITNAVKGLKAVNEPLKKEKIQIQAIVKVGKKGNKENSENEVSSSQSSNSSQEPINSSQEPTNSLQEPTNSQESNSSNNTNSQTVAERNQTNLQKSQETKPVIDDIDAENMGDITQVALYVRDIFIYYKEREVQFMVDDYMERQTSLTTNMRAILVDWLVEVQENFELNHETLYLAVKLVDSYLNKVVIKTEMLQLIGASSLFISCKFDERCPPLVEDFLYICDEAYNRKAFLDMERTILKTIDFDLGIPLSYRFLRRYAKCGRATMETLTLARYILELSLMDYEVLKFRDSKLGAAALLLAMKMKRLGDWTPTLVHYTDYTAKDLENIMQHLNSMLTSPPNVLLTTIQSKYSHRVFYEVAKLAPLDVLELL